MRNSKEMGEKVKRFLLSQQYVESRKSDLTKAECEYKNAITELGKYLCPDNAKVGEEFLINDFSIRFRK